MRAVAALASLAVLASAGAAAATSQAVQPPRAYRVTVRATLQERAVQKQAASPVSL
jgi:hypothetical protein